ncbi:MAG: hypothetical protein ABSA30_07955 [Candidatus Aminicenantales bacterium]|jgi:hypothetical protein
MRNATKWIAAAAACLWAAPARPFAEPFAWNREAAEKLLRTAAVAEVSKTAESGRTAPWIVFLDGPGGVRTRAIFKHMNRTRPRPMPASWRYEIAACKLADLLGLDIIPPTVERPIEGVPGALQIFVEDSLSERDRERLDLRPPDETGFRRALDEIRVFEILTGSACGDKDDTLIHKPTWKVCRVDFSESFPTDPALDETCPLERCPRRLYERMLRTARLMIESNLKGYLSDSEINSLSERKKRIVARLQQLIDEKGERAVLF